MATYNSGPRVRLQDFSCTNYVRFICERASGTSDPTPPSPSATCPDGTWTIKGSRCYKLFSTTASRSSANTQCTTAGGRLFQLRNFQESLYLDSLYNVAGTSIYVCFYFF
jgi:hypothetical protein